MSRYVKNFVTGHGINFMVSKRNLEAFRKADALWREIDESLEINSRSIILLCGAKNNGKSALARYLVNNYTQKYSSACPAAVTSDTDEKGFTYIDAHDTADSKSAASEEAPEDVYAYYVDFDPGQPEMTSPGMISAHIIRSSDGSKLQSPTYLNMFQHESLVMSSVGGTNMSVNPKMFIENCRHVFNLVREHQSRQTTRRPIFVNTMGHIRNVGLALLMDLIKICRPTELIVLNVANDAMRTIYADLSPEAMQKTRSSFFYEEQQAISKRKLNYQCRIYELQFTFTDSAPMASRNRTALQLAYMASIPEALYKPVMQLNAKWLSFESVYVYCVSSYPLKQGIILELLQNSWIHLIGLKQASRKDVINSDEVGAGSEVICKIIDNVDGNTLYGCGIVAEIDLEKKRLAIITPVDQETLSSKVDCILKPLSIQVPHEMLQEKRISENNS